MAPFRVASASCRTQRAARMPALSEQDEAMVFQHTRLEILAGKCTACPKTFHLDLKTTPDEIAPDNPSTAARAERAIPAGQNPAVAIYRLAASCRQESLHLDYLLRGYCALCFTVMSLIWHNTILINGSPKEGLRSCQKVVHMDDFRCAVRRRPKQASRQQGRFARIPIHCTRALKANRLRPRCGRDAAAAAQAEAPPDVPAIKKEAGTMFRPRIIKVVPLTGFEPAAFCSGGRRSIP